MGVVFVGLLALVTGTGPTTGPPAAVRSAAPAPAPLRPGTRRARQAAPEAGPVEVPGGAGDDGEPVGEVDVDPETEALRAQVWAEVRALRQRLGQPDPDASGEAFDGADELLASEAVRSGRAGSEIENQLHEIRTRAASELWMHAERAEDDDLGKETRALVLESARDWLDQASQTGRSTILAQRYCEAAAGAKGPCAVGAGSDGGPGER